MPAGRRLAPAAIAAVAFVLSAAGATWGLPGEWHPDEVVRPAMRLLSDRTLEPESFAYPTLHMLVLSGSAAIPDVALHAVSNLVGGRAILAGLDPGFWDEVPRITLFARLVSAALAAATCLVVARIGTRLFGRTTGLAAAGLLALTAGFVGLAHFATVDVAATFWGTLSFLATLEALERRTWAAFALAGLALGLAASAKYTGILLAVPLGLSVLMARAPSAAQGASSERVRRSVWAAVGAVAGFVLGTPGAVVAFPRFVGDFVQLNFYQPDYLGQGTSGYLAHLGNLVGLEGPPLAAAALVGIAVLAVRAVRRREPGVVLLLAAVATIYLKMGSMPFAPSRYALPLVPFLSLAAAVVLVGLVRGHEGAPGWARSAGRIAALSCAVLTGAWGILGVSEFFHDDRDRATDWLVEHVAPTASIETSHAYAPNIPAAYARVSRIPFHHVKAGFRAMARSDAYRSLVNRLPWAEFRSFPEVARDEPEETALAALLARAPDVLVLSEACYGRFLLPGAAAQFPKQSEMYRAILSGGTPYRVAVDFRSEPSPWRPRIEFVHGGITILERGGSLLRRP